MKLAAVTGEVGPPDVLLGGQTALQYHRLMKSSHAHPADAECVIKRM